MLQKKLTDESNRDTEVLRRHGALVKLSTKVEGLVIPADDATKTC